MVTHILPRIKSHFKSAVVYTVSIVNIRATKATQKSILIAKNPTERFDFSDLNIFIFTMLLSKCKEKLNTQLASTQHTLLLFSSEYNLLVYIMFSFEL